MKTDKQRLVETIKTGKAPGRRNLFKHTFSLAGLPYGGLKFSDGVTKRDGSRRVVILSTAGAEETKKKLSLFFKSVNVIDGLDGSLNIAYLNPDWKLIDTLRK